jgi:hypothetical protein
VEVAVEVGVPFIGLGGRGEVAPGRWVADNGGDSIPDHFEE